MKFDAEKINPEQFYWGGLSELCSDNGIYSSLKHVIFDFKKCLKAKDNLELRDAVWCLYTTVSEYLRSLSPSSATETIILDIGKVYIYGSQKYGVKNYLSITDVRRFVNAIGRHLIFICMGFNYDSESTYSHFTHIYANIFIITEVLLKKQIDAKILAFNDISPRFGAA